MKPSITKLICLSLFLFSLKASTICKAACQPGADATALNQTWQAYLTNLSTKAKDRIVIAPFQNLKGLQADPIMTDGMPFLIYNMFSNTNGEFLHPYVSLEAAHQAGLTGATLTDIKNIKSLAKTLHARLVIFGSVQRSTADVVRVILRVYDAKTDSVGAPPVQFATELNDAFFSLTRQKIQELLQTVRVKIKPSNDTVDPTLQADRFYVRGMQLSSKYDSTNLNLAALWFEKALKENYQNYDDAALGLARSYFMLALIEKLNKADFSQDFIKGRDALAGLRHTQDSPKYRLSLRYHDNATAFLNALTALKNHNNKIAATQAAAAVTAVPEDGVSAQIGVLSGAPATKIIVHPPVCL